MDNKTTSNPPDHDELRSRSLKIASLGLTIIGICILFIIAFIGFQPDQYSLSDRYFPSPTVTLTRTPTPTPTPNWTATQEVIQATAAAQAIATMIVKAENQWSILRSDDFASNENSWVLGSDKNESGKVFRSIKNGSFIWDVVSNEDVYFFSTADTKPLTDFYLSVDAAKLRGSSAYDYGLIFRKDDNNDLYYFGIERGGYFISLNYNGEWTNLLDWTQSSAVRPGEKNNLTVIAQGSHFIFFINDQHMIDITDDHIARGQTGLAISLHSQNQQASFEFDNFELREP